MYHLLILVLLAKISIALSFELVQGGHEGHGGHHQGHDHHVYFVPTLKNAAGLADLVFGQAHFT